MPSQYLQPNELIVYGLPNSTDVTKVIAASTMIDAYLRRQEGLVYNSDFLGLPCYMAALQPTLTLKSSGAIAPGNQVVVSLAQNIMPYTDMVGDVVILDRNTPDSCEACIIANIAQGQITLANVATNHNTNCTIDFGLTIFEERSLPKKRSICRVDRPPVRFLSGMGRYGYGRRTDQMAGMSLEVNLLAAVQAFGGPPMWEPFTISDASISLTTKEIWVPAGILLAYFSDVRIRYISGYQQSALPYAIKLATAQLITASGTEPLLTGQITTIKAADTTVQRKAASMLSDDVRAMLKPFSIISTL